jgi:transposase, IS30 family
MKHKHLTAADRGAIEVLLQKNCTLTDIAKAIGKSVSTVSREIKKRSVPNGYKANSAQANYEDKREACKQRKKLNNLKRQKYIVKKLMLGWSPEQIAGRLRLKNRKDLYVCKETVYAWIYENEWAKKENLYQYLRLGRKKRKKKTGRKVHRGKIPNRVSIHKRPKIAEKRKQLGHWEGDSVIYPSKMAINTLNELYSGLVRFTKLDRKTAKLTSLAMIRRLKKVKARTLTLDNGSEFYYHKKVSRKANIKIFFADPYSSWQRGANENANMLLRGYLPKRCNDPPGT